MFLHIKNYLIHFCCLLIKSFKAYSVSLFPFLLKKPLYIPVIVTDYPEAATGGVL